MWHSCNSHQLRCVLSLDTLTPSVDADADQAGWLLSMLAWCLGCQVNWNRLLKQNATDWLLLFSRSVMSDSLKPHGLQHIRLPCPSPSPRVHSNSCALGRWRHQTISSSIVPFSSCLQSFPASESLPSGSQSIEASASAWVLPMNT